MSSQYFRMSCKYPNQPPQNVSPVKSQSHYRPKTPNKYYVQINLKENSQRQQPTQDQVKLSINAFNPSQQVSREVIKPPTSFIRQDGSFRAHGLTLVKSPSTSFSPFRKNKNQNETRRPLVQNVRIKLQLKGQNQQEQQPRNQYQNQTNRQQLSTKLQPCQLLQKEMQQNYYSSEAKVFKEIDNTLIQSTQMNQYQFQSQQIPKNRNSTGRLSNINNQLFKENSFESSIQNQDYPKQNSLYDNQSYKQTQSKIQLSLQRKPDNNSNGKELNRIRESHQGEGILNETIEKLDYLEQKISSIMLKNDQLRSMLSRQDGPKLENKPHNSSFTQHVKYVNMDSNMNSISQNYGSGDKIQSFNQYLKNQANQTREENSNISRLHSQMKVYPSIQIPQPIGHHSTQSVLVRYPIHHKEDNTHNPSIRQLIKNQWLKIVLIICQASSRVEEVQHDYKYIFIGKKIYPNGYMYEGEWLDGIRQGLGTLFNPLGMIIYQGEWRQDQFNGRGRFVNELTTNLEANETFTSYQSVIDAWKSYEGEFRDGSKHGLGVMNFGDYKYHGHFESDVFHGSGSVMSENDGKLVIKGIWDEGEFKR